MKKLELKPIIISIILVLSQSILYAISKSINLVDTITIGNYIDTLIPFKIYFIIPYCLWYLLIFVMPYYYYRKDKDILVKYVISYLLISLVANIIFILCKTTVIRPEITGNGILQTMTRIVFDIDTPAVNCFPSLHCAISFLWIIYTFNTKNTNKYFKVIITIISILIILSTLFIKQHVFIDMLGGISLTILITIIVKHSNLLILRTKKALKINQ